MYILIIPGFGIVSQIISTFAEKPVFGQLALYLRKKITQQAICKNAKKCTWYYNISSNNVPLYSKNSSIYC